LFKLRNPYSCPLENFREQGSGKACVVAMMATSQQQRPAILGAGSLDFPQPQFLALTVPAGVHPP
jgi:hypothetical protein